MDESLLYEGLTLMLAGMGTVFVFLTTLVIAISLMSALLGRRRADDDVDADTVAAITAAVRKHREKRRG